MKKFTRARKILTLIGVLALCALGIKYAVTGHYELLFIDVAVALLGLFLFNHLYDRFHQDEWSYAAFLILLVLHCSYLYELSPLGIRWDHYMHTYAGIAIALIADRLFKLERWGNAKRGVVLILLAAGVGSIHEIVEWIGYAYLGRGEGFLLFGAGDEGEWRNSILDMLCNTLGAFVCTLIIVYKKKRA
jgi:uncharacterized membrane protein YjdF